MVMRELKKYLWMRRDEIWMILALEAGMFLAGLIMCRVMAGIFGEKTLFELGTILALGSGFICMAFIGIGVLAQCFNLGISMGAVRKRILPFYAAVTYMECLAAAAEAFLLYRLESWILRTLYTGIQVEETMIGSIFQWKYMIMVSLAVTAWNTFFGTLFLKYGKAAFFILWAIWVGTFAGGPQIPGILQKHKDAAAVKAVQAVFDFLMSITESGIFAGLCVISAVFLLISWILLRRQQVK